MYAETQVSRAGGTLHLVVTGASIAPVTAHSGQPNSFRSASERDSAHYFSLRLWLGLFNPQRQLKSITWQSPTSPYEPTGDRSCGALRSVRGRASQQEQNFDLIFARYINAQLIAECVQPYLFGHFHNYDDNLLSSFRDSALHQRIQLVARKRKLPIPRALTT